MSPQITVGEGGFTGPPGTYPVILAKIEGPKTITAKRGPTAGQSSDIYDWTFVVVGGEYEDAEIDATSSTASGPKSKLYSFLTALLGGQAPQAGQTFELADLKGRMALATVVREESGWAKIAQLSAMPVQYMQQQFAQVTGAPVAAPPAPPAYAPPQAAPAAPQQPIPAPVAPTPAPAPVIPVQPVPAAPVPQPAAAPPQPGEFVMPAGQQGVPAPAAPLREQVAGPAGELPF